MLRRIDLHWQILIALSLGVAAGMLFPKGTILPGGVQPYAIFDFLGSTFLRALRMVIVPLLTGSIISGIVGVGANRGLGRMFSKTFAWYITTSLMAILVGLFLVNLIQPGVSGHEAVGQRLGLSETPPELAASLEGRGAGDLVHILQRMIPPNPVAAAAEGQMLPLIFFCLVFGIAITTLPEDQRKAQLGFWSSLFSAMMRLTGWVIMTAPVGIFGLMAKITAASGFAAFAPLARYGLTVLGALIIHAVITLPLLIFLLGRLSPRKHFRVMAPALLTAFSTRSSSATLPLTMDRIENGAGVSNRVTSFVLPLGATVNMDGTALYECVAALFIAQAYGVELGFGAQMLVVLTALLASIGAAGIPAAGLVMISIILDAVGLPLEGLALILAIDPILDMCRTAVNVWSDSCGAVVVARSEGEEQVLKKDY
ncbi:MAG: dicarboxylate/amino acid:cation symporter [Gemmatimonadales bacterium]|nr:dicarboxylate/amino acid:cation symporter [Gemmatimonadales bacterium]